MGDSIDFHDRNQHVLHADSHERGTITDGDGAGWDYSRPTRPQWASSQVDHDEFLQMKKRIAMLERRLAQSAKPAVEHRHSSSRSLEAASSYAEGDGNGDDDSDDHIKQEPEKRSILPQLKRQVLEDFINKYEDEEHEYAIELLMRSLNPLKPLDTAAHTGARISSCHDSRSSAEPQMKGLFQPHDINSEAMPGRVRINSPWILNLLAGIDSEIDPTASITFLRPWKFLAYHEQKIRELVSNVVYPQSGDDDISGNRGPRIIQDSRSLETAASTHIMDDHDHDEEVQHLKCLIEFFDQYIKPLKQKFDGDHGDKIMFKDLFWLFNPGDDIYMPVKVRGRSVNPDAVSSTPETFQGRYERMWRVTATSGGYWNLAGDHALSRKLRASPFKVSCYYIDFDGKYFLPVTHTFSIMPFDGEINITDLDFFPASYVKDHVQNMERDIRRGRWIFDQMSKRHTHFYYAGPTLVVHPCGCPLQGETLHQEYIESEIIVDFRTTLLRNPSWRPRSSLWKPPPRSKRHTETLVRHWSNRTRQRSLGATYDNVYDGYLIDLQRSIDFRDQEIIFAPVPSEWLTNESRMPEKDVRLLTSRGFAFVLRTRSFAPISLNGLQDIKPQTDGLHTLQLRDNGVKETVRALVRTHFRQDQRTIGGESEYDIVRGKGKGLIILLHGAPGVGKTSTAESIASANGKPLFQITCGDLGLTPKEVEKALKEIFRYAQMWQCILLLDECDVFLGRRTRDDIQRNSLVSVFLRVLEFYTGVLFLTTNRVGVLDDAVRSRISWEIYYPPLDMEQTKMIWKTNLDLLKERNPGIRIDRKGILKFAKDQFDNATKEQPAWNGRQIQNAFKVVNALAEWDTMTSEEKYSFDLQVRGDEDHAKRRLIPEQFEKVAAATKAFDRYLHEVTAGTEGDRAWKLMERADEHNPEAEEEIANEYLSPPLKEARSPSLSATHLYTRRPSNPGLGPLNGLQIDVDSGARAVEHRASEHTYSRYITSPDNIKTSLMASNAPQSQARRSSHGLAAVHNSFNPPQRQTSKRRPGGVDMGYSSQLPSAQLINRKASTEMPDMSYERESKRSARYSSDRRMAPEEGHFDDQAITGSSSGDDWDEGER